MLLAWGPHAVLQPSPAAVVMGPCSQQPSAIRHPLQPSHFAMRPQCPPPHLLPSALPPPPSPPALPPCPSRCLLAHARMAEAEDAHDRVEPPSSHTVTKPLMLMAH